MSKKNQFIEELEKKIKNCKIDSSNPLFVNSILNITDEVLNSSIIAWILHLNDGPKKYWFLNELLKKVDSNHEHIGKAPLDIIKEESTKSGKRIDIIVRWSDFVLIIENKTKSKEHDSQCEIYLNDNKGNNPHLIYLTINGESPPSIDSSESEWSDAFTDLSYRDLFNCLDNTCEKMPKDSSQPKDSIQFYIKIITDYMISLQYLIKSGMIIKNNTIKEERRMKDIDENIAWLFKKENKQKLNKFIGQAKDITEDFMLDCECELKKKVDQNFEGKFEKPFEGGHSIFYYRDAWTCAVNGVEIHTGYQFYFGAGKTEKKKGDYRIIGEREYFMGIKLMNLQFEGKGTLSKEKNDLWAQTKPKKRIIINQISKTLGPLFNKGKTNVLWAYLPEQGYVYFSNNTEREKWIDDTTDRFIEMIYDTYDKIEDNIEDILE